MCVSCALSLGREEEVLHHKSCKTRHLPSRWGHHLVEGREVALYILRTHFVFSVTLVVQIDCRTSQPYRCQPWSVLIGWGRWEGDRKVGWGRWGETVKLGGVAGGRP